MANMANMDFRHRSRSQPVDRLQHFLKILNFIISLKPIRLNSFAAN